MTGDATPIDSSGRPAGLRELKKQRTRRALTDAAFRMFAEQGYERTTVAEIAAEAEVATKTFFNYFPDKEAVVFHDAQVRLAHALQELGGRRPGEAPSALLSRTIGDVLDRLLTDDNAIHTRHLALWLELLFTVPALQARGLRITFEVERQLTEAFLHAYPGRFDQVTAAAMVGAVMGAAQSALGSTLQSEDSLEDARAAVRRSLELVVRGIRTADDEAEEPESAPTIGSS